MPLFEGQRSRKLSGANAGLRFNKFVNNWNITDNKCELGTAKKEWLKLFAKPNKKHGKAGELASACDRLRRIASACVPDTITNTPKAFVNVSRFVTGLGYEHGVENGFVWHHTLGVPYLPSSGVKGLMRAYADHWGGIGEQGTKGRVERIVELFGNYGPPARNEQKRPELDGFRDAQMGRLIVFDVLPLAPVQCALEVMTPHDGGWRAKGHAEGLSPGDWHDPNPIPFLAVEEGQEFLFALGLARGGTQADLDEGYRLLAEALDWLGAGAKTAVGYGWFITPEAKVALGKADAEAEAELVEAIKAAEQGEHEAWQPATGQILRQTTEDRPEKVLVEILEVDGSSEIFVRHRDGSDGFWVEKDECIFHADSWDKA